MKQRQVNFELLRIIAMLMVLGLHANFMALGIPTPDDILTIDGVTRTFLQSFCIIAVNVFVMISGWFGIKPSIKGFCNFMWQVVFCVGGVYLVGAIFFNQPFGVKDLMKCFGLYYGGGWFVASYIGLYIISPILNSYIERTSTKNIFCTLAAFFLFEFLWGNTLSVEFVVGGYSTFSFIGIYILSGTLHKIKIQYSNRFVISVFFALITLNAIAYVFAVKLNMIGFRDTIFNYINPIVIIAAACMIILFSRITPHLQNSIIQRIILWAAASCFAAYILHGVNRYVLNLYLSNARHIYELTGNFALLGLIVYIVIVFLIATIIDQPRKWIWRKFLLPLFDK